MTDASIASKTTSRRTVLAGAASTAATVAVAAVAGCATYGKQPAGGGGDGGGGSTGPVALGHTSDIPVGGGKVFAEREVVVTQPTQGTFKCFTAICTHAGCTVGDVTGGTINCPCHGSKYHITDGSVAQGPAPRPLAPQAITVTNDTITLG